MLDYLPGLALAAIMVTSPLWFLLLVYHVVSAVERALQRRRDAK